MNNILQTKTKASLKAQKKENLSILESILEARGIQDIEKYLNPLSQPLSSPFIFSDMKKAIEIINDAIQKNEKILIWGDFDADGVTSTSIIYKALVALGAKVIYFMPDRLKLGHGIDLKTLLTLKAKNNIKVLITVDCGISNIKEINLIKSMGVKVILTDHHQPPSELPAADCIINPLAKNALCETLSVQEIQDNSYLAGAGVALKLAFALLSDDFKEVKNEILALSCVGTIADVVPLLGENRIIVSYGLEKINLGCHKGISRLFNKLNITKKITSEDIAFILAPRINSAGRLDLPDLSIKLLIDENQYTVDATIEKLDCLNKVRQNLCDKTYEEALLKLNNPEDLIVLYDEGWHIGIIGIVASKLVEKFNLPVFLITKDENEVYRCSARGTEGLDISKILTELKHCFLGFGGHSLAGGFSADSNSITIDELKDRLKNTVIDFKQEGINLPSAKADMELEGEDLTPEFILELEKMEPFGAQNERPKFLFQGAKLLSERQIGKEANHISYTIAKDDKLFNCLYWKRKLLGFSQGETLDFIFRPEINSYNGEEKIQLITEVILNDKFNESYLSPLKLFDHREKTNIISKVEEYVKNKKGEVKIWAATSKTKKLLEKFPYIIKNIIDENTTPQKTVMFFDFPPNQAEFTSLLRKLKPNNIHLMNSVYSKNPTDSFIQVCGMLKYAHNNKNGEIDTKALSLASGMDEVCIHLILEILENLGSIKIYDIDKIEFVKPPKQNDIVENSLYELYIEEFKRVVSFKDFLKTADLNTLEELCKY